MKRIILWLLALPLLAQGYTQNGNVYSTDGSQADFKAALLACSNGSVIKIPAGNFTWGETASRANIGVAIQGAGVDSTTINSATNVNGSPRLVDITGDGIKVSGISFKGQRFLTIGGNKNGVPFRVWNCSFDSGSVQAIFVELGGNIAGLIDHCAFSGGGASEMIHDNGLGSSDTGGWKDDIIPGSEAAVYIENCTFSKNPLDDKYFYGTCAFQGYYGSRDVIRYCKLNYTHIDVHGGSSLAGGRWWEFYENTFYVPGGGNQSDFYALRGGSGVVFNNHLTGGPNLGAGQINLYSDQAQNPPLYGPGAGIQSVSGARQTSPAYFWANPFPVSRGSSNVQEGRDFVVSDSEPGSMKKVQLRSDNANTTYSYKPLAYPHPADDLPSDIYGPSGGAAPSPTPSSTPVPTPTPTPNPTPTPVSQTYRGWLDKLSDWVRQNPAIPDQ